MMSATPPSTAEIRTRLAALMPELKARQGVRSLSIFGSYARGEQTPESDLDLLVDFDETPNLYEFVRLGLDLEEALGLKVDLVMRQTLKPRLERYVMQDLIAV